MKKNKTNNNTSNTTKNISARQLKKQNKEQHAKEKEQRAKERIAAKEARKQQNEHKAVTVNAKPIKKALKSMGGVSITTLTKEQRENLVIKRNLLRKKREKLYEERRIASLKRRNKNGEKTPEELKKSIDDLIKEIRATKRYDILLMFNPSIKDMIVQSFKNENITPTFLGDDYGWIRDVGSNVLDKVREILPEGVSVNPYKAQEKKDAVPKKVKKPSNNTDEAKKAAKAHSKTENIRKFLDRSNHKRGPRKLRKIVAKFTLAQKTKDNKNNVNTKAA